MLWVERRHGSSTRNGTRLDTRLGKGPWRSRLWSGAWQASPKARAARPQYDQITAARAVTEDLAVRGQRGAVNWLRTAQGDSEGTLECPQVRSQSAAPARRETSEGRTVENLPKGSQRGVSEGEETLRNRTSAHRGRDHYGDQEWPGGLPSGPELGHQWDWGQARAGRGHEDGGMGIPHRGRGGSHGARVPSGCLYLRLSSSMRTRRAVERALGMVASGSLMTPEAAAMLLQDDHGPLAPWVPSRPRGCGGRQQNSGAIHQSARCVCGSWSAGLQGAFPDFSLTAEDGHHAGWWRSPDQPRHTLAPTYAPACEGRTFAASAHGIGHWRQPRRQAGTSSTSYAPFRSASGFGRERPSRRTKRRKKW